jgi:hypothetical protein
LRTAVLAPNYPREAGSDRADNRNCDRFRLIDAERRTTEKLNHDLINNLNIGYIQD